MAEGNGILAARPSRLRVAPGLLHGRLTPPPSKSCAHRALICAALAGRDMSGRESVIRGLGEPSDDILVTQACLFALLDGDGTLDCGESGTTLRLLVPVAAALGRPVTFTGRGRLPQRPLKEYEEAFRGHGTTLRFAGEASLPVSLRGRLAPGRFELPGHVSSQYVSGLLLALPLLAGDSDIVLTSALQSAPYVDLTREIMARFGVEAEPLPPDPDRHPFGGFHVPGGQRYRPADYHVETDYSQAAFWLAANYLGSAVELPGLPERTSQGDRAIVGLLGRLAAMDREPDHRLEIDASQIPDLVPILAVAAAFTPGTTRIVNAARLRLKESDRLASVADSLTAIGADIRVTGDGLEIRGETVLRGGETDSRNDHRIAMAMAIAATRTQTGVVIRDPWCVDKSYPRFFDDLLTVGGVVT
ncbi:MAG: 3-phosphoshikimate 1-carboxyvinyltransferase [Clostridia bacterium]|nr:3-phosphoshikimate 1-carboxyvinyltransferase [Clostridia bacterium]